MSRDNRFHRGQTEQSFVATATIDSRRHLAKKHGHTAEGAGGRIAPAASGQVLRGAVRVRFRPGGRIIFQTRFA